MKNKQAFTLIELLVVILIIGILASIALPTYKKAVNKAEMSNVYKTFRTIEKAMRVYHLNTGEWPTSLDQLDVQIPTNSKWLYSLVNSTGGESCVYPNPYTQPRGWASIRADRPSWGTHRGSGWGAVFYSIRGRTSYSNKPGVFCCIWGNNAVSEKWRKFCQDSKTSDSAGSCYTGSYISVHLEE